MDANINYEFTRHVFDHCSFAIALSYVDYSYATYTQYSHSNDIHVHDHKWKWFVAFYGSNNHSTTLLYVYINTYMIVLIFACIVRYCKLDIRD